MDHRTLVETSMTYWAAGDIERVMTTLSDDVVYQVYVAQTALPYGGEWSGKDAVRDVFFDVFALFDAIEFNPTILDVRDGIARCQCQYVFRHRPSGEWLSGSCRLVCTIQNDLISRLDEFHDEPMVVAFTQLAKQRALEGRGAPAHGKPWK